MKYDSLSKRQKSINRKSDGQTKPTSPPPPKSWLIGGHISSMMSLSYVSTFEGLLYIGITSAAVPVAICCTKPNKAVSPFCLLSKQSKQVLRFGFADLSYI